MCMASCSFLSVVCFAAFAGKIKSWTRSFFNSTLAPVQEFYPLQETCLPMPLQSEEELIQAAIQRDAAAWKFLLDQYGGKMYGMALRFLSNEKDAEDAVQEVWILISQKLTEFRGGSRLGTWIYRITANKCLERIRSSKKSKEKTESIDALMPEFTEDGHYKKEFADWSQRPDKEADQKALKREIENAVNSLPEEYREVLILRDIEGFSGEEAAEMLSIPEASMKTRLHRARMAVREKLEKKYGKKPWSAFLRMLML